MKEARDILFTGVSSLTGLWFVHELSQAGFRVTATLKRKVSDYEGLRLQRVSLAATSCTLVEECAFGSTKFLELVRSKPHWALLCHHAADVTDYKSPDFNVTQAVANNTYALREILAALKQHGNPAILLTGSVFEQHEGAGSDHLRAVSPYGLSKGLTSDYFRFYCEMERVRLAKFVIPNPFGPYEEMRFTSFLIQKWMQGQSPSVNSPAYVRDNIPVTLLAKAYASYAQKIAETSALYTQYNPSFYVDSQGAFTSRFAEEMRKRLDLPCDYVLHAQKEFPEPKIRINTEPLNPLELNWNEEKAWDELALYYSEFYKPSLCV